MIRPPPTSTLFPYPTLFRSAEAPGAGLADSRALIRSRLVVISVSARSLLGNSTSVASTAELNVESRSRSEEHTSELQSPDHLLCPLRTAQHSAHGTARVEAR